MSNLSLTPKQELFAQSVSSGISQSDSYRLAYDSENMKDATIASKASILMTDGNIRARVQELREPVIKKAQLTLESHLNDLQSLRNMATKEKQYSAAISAEIARGKVSGLYIENVNSVVTGTIKQSVEITVIDVNKA